MDGQHGCCSRLYIGRGGKSLQTFPMGRGMYQGERDGEELDEFLKNCPNVKSLSINSTPFSAWKKFGMQIEARDVMIAHGSDFPLHFAVRKLTVFTSPHSWERIGNSLEKLVVLFEFSVKDEVDKIKLHCPKLTSVSLEGSKEEDKDAIAALLASYGDKLEYAYLCEMHEGQLMDVVRACPKARVRLRTISNFPVPI